MIHCFDGIFLRHYVLDAFLWRFREPFYRREVSPLWSKEMAALFEWTEAQPGRALHEAATKSRAASDRSSRRSTARGAVPAVRPGHRAGGAGAR